MPNLPPEKVQANFALTAEVRTLLRVASDAHRRIDGSHPSRVSDYVEDLLRRDMMAKGLIPLPVIVMPATRRPTTSTPVSRPPTTRKPTTRKATSRKPTRKAAR